jgi:Tfp pilus assembly protein FimT
LDRRTSLVEMIVVAAIGLMAVFAWPKVQTILNQSQVRSARLAVLNKFNQTDQRSINQPERS